MNCVMYFSEQPQRLNNYSLFAFLTASQVLFFVVVIVVVVVIIVVIIIVV